MTFEQTMYKLPNFNKVFTFVLFIGLFLGVYSLLANYFGWNHLPKSGEPTILFRLTSHLPYLVLNTVLWISIGYLFDEMRAALITLGVFLLTVISGWFLFPFKFDPNTSMLWYILRDSFVFIPFLVFGALTLKDKRMWMFLLVALVAKASFLVGFGNGLTEFLNRIFRMFFEIRDAFEIQIPTSETGYRTVYPLSGILNSLQLPILFLVTSQLLYSLKNNHAFLSGKTIDLSNTFSKRKATIIYFIFRFGLYGMAAGALFYFSQNFIRHNQNIAQQIVFGISFIGALYLISLTYRNFLTEYCFSRNNSPSGFYFLWNIPFFNIIAWILSLFSLEKTNSELDRKKLFKKSRWDKNNGLKVLFIIFLFLIFLTKLDTMGFRVDGPSPTEAWVYLAAGLIGFGILIWYLSHPFGIYVIIGLATLLLLSDVIIGATIPTPRRSGGGYYTNISNAVIYFSLFHLAFLNDVGLVEVADDSGDQVGIQEVEDL